MAKEQQPKASPLRILNTCLWLIDQLQTHGRMNYVEINERWIEHNATLNKARTYDLEKRTLSNYWKYIDTMFDIVVKCDRATNEYYIAENYDTKMTDWLLSTFSVSRILSESRDIQKRILLENIPSGQKFLTPIISAMKENHPIEMEYQKFSDAESHKIHGMPLCLKLVQQRWYVLMQVTGKVYWPLYALDRIKSLSVETTKTSDLPEGFEANKVFEYSFGAFTSGKEEREEIIIEANIMQSNYWRTLPIHPSQQETKRENCSWFYFEMKVTPDLVNYLMSLGDRIKVLRPESLVRQMGEEHRRAAALYGC